MKNNKNMKKEKKITVKPALHWKKRKSLIQFFFVAKFI